MCLTSCAIPTTGVHAWMAAADRGSLVWYGLASLKLCNQDMLLRWSVVELGPIPVLYDYFRLSHIAGVRYGWLRSFFQAQAKKTSVSSPYHYSEYANSSKLSQCPLVQRPKTITQREVKMSTMILLLCQRLKNRKPLPSVHDGLSNL